MIVEYVRYALTRSAPEDLIEAYRTGGRHLEAAPECIDFDLAQCSEAPESVVVRITWRSAEAHMSGFRRGPHFPPFLAAVRPFIGEMVEMRHYETRLPSKAAS